jgi:hypothetical protein
MKAILDIKDTTITAPIQPYGSYKVPTELYQAMVQV